MKMDTRERVSTSQNLFETSNGGGKSGSTSSPKSAGNTRNHCEESRSMDIVVFSVIGATSERNRARTAGSAIITACRRGINT